MSVDTIGNFLTIIRNGIRVSKPSVAAPYSKINYRIAQILKDEGYVRDVVVEQEGSFKNLKIVLKYVDGESVIHEIKRVSTPGKRVYRSITNVPPVIGNLGIVILTTNRGIITDKQARQLNIGGELICELW